MQQRLPTYFISHGGGPWPWIPDMRARLATLEASLADIPRQVGLRPRAILMVSGHWEAPEFSVMATAEPPMVYDYYGFPPHTYEIRYAAPGAPDVAARVQQLLKAQGIPATLDTRQGFDHGVFAPMRIIYPEADVPVLQLSLKAGYDPEAHFAAGRALAPLRDEGILIVGSGLSYHNLRAFGPMARLPSSQFDAWLRRTLALPPADRTAALNAWDNAPAARQAHPQEDHLVPLMVALGAAENEAATLVYHDTSVFGGVTASSYRFGEGAEPVAAAFETATTAA